MKVEEIYCHYLTQDDNQSIKITKQFKLVKKVIFIIVSKDINSTTLFLTAFFSY